MRNLIPNYIYTLGFFKCNSPKNGQIIVCDKTSSDNKIFLMLEKVSGKPITNDYLKIYPVGNLINILLQVILALWYGQEYFYFTHNDLHPGNIIIEDLKTPINISYYIESEQKTFRITTSKLARIIDYGTARFEYSRVAFGGDSNSWNVAKFHPGLDLYKITIGCFYVGLSALLAGAIEYTDVAKIFAFGKFFEKRDPYHFVDRPLDELLKSATLGAERSFSITGLLDADKDPRIVTPKEYIDWILTNIPDAKDMIQITNEKGPTPNYYKQVRDVVAKRPPFNEVEKPIVNLQQMFPPSKILTGNIDNLLEYNRILAIEENEFMKIYRNMNYPDDGGVLRRFRQAKHEITERISNILLSFEMYPMDPIEIVRYSRNIVENVLGENIKVLDAWNCLSKTRDFYIFPK